MNIDSVVKAQPEPNVLRLISWRISNAYAISIALLARRIHGFFVLMVIGHRVTKLICLGFHRPRFKFDWSDKKIARFSIDVNGV